MVKGISKRVIVVRPDGHAPFEQDVYKRQAVGRLCCAIAAEADAVIRVIAGIPQYIKGENPCI